MRYIPAPVSLALIAACLSVPAVVLAQDSFSASVPGSGSVASVAASLTGEAAAVHEDSAQEYALDERAPGDNWSSVQPESSLAAAAEASLHSGMEAGAPSSLPSLSPLASLPSHLLTRREAAQGQGPGPGRRAWTWSLAPLVASQALDSASSYGMRELNPLLADPNGGFGMKAASMTFAVVGALIGAEYLILRKSPRFAKLFSLLNWSGTGVTAGLAVHNYAIR